ncbi:hypothetical protein CONPUDRAFT_137434 [Coniophora puteana RWD-64-598 SS2]|uniref:Uncharacterized protein n=1 Tax=Coniophora puteana (strain RWD-64-598) TaxID=741705 RepID=A0A5M3MSP5_CONPW|nr:uncharacterized protein CONPUDRAFT_137434 [Coniophora puteana RWD-64-598 SS2]EIW81551.1 hypothetical protein CONPUDRAFT_137434 [Coniophora puteana RWD-64-598 SS2]
MTSSADAADATSTACHTTCNEISERTSVSISVALILFVFVFIAMQAVSRWNHNNSSTSEFPRPTPAGHRPHMLQRWRHDLPRVSAHLVSFFPRVHLSLHHHHHTGADGLGRVRSNPEIGGAVELEAGRAHVGVDAAATNASSSSSSSSLPPAASPGRRSDLDVEIASRSEDGAGGSCTLGGSSIASSKKDGEGGVDVVKEEVEMTEDVRAGNNVRSAATAPLPGEDVGASLVQEQDQAPPLHKDTDADGARRVYDTSDIGETTCAMAPEHDAGVDTIGMGRQAVQ